MASAGSIVIDLLLKTGSFSTDTARSASDLKKLQKQAYDTGKAIGDSIRNIAAAVGVGLSVNAFAGLIKGSIDAADHLNDLSKKTGIAVDTLGGIGFAAQQSGSDLDSASAAIGKLNKTLAEAAAGNVLAQQGFDALGISVKDAGGNTKAADVVFAEVADKFASYSDGPEKAALAIRLFGKAGADSIPLLDEGGRKLQENVAYYKQYSGVTQDVAAKSDQFNDTLTKIHLLSGAVGTTIASELLPSLQAIADEFLHIKETGDGFKGTAELIKAAFDGIVVAGATVSFVMLGIGREAGALAAQFAILSGNSLTLEGALTNVLNPGRALFNLFRSANSEGFKAISESVKQDGKDARAELDRFLADYASRVAKAKPAGDFFSSAAAIALNGGKGRAPRLADSGAAASASAELKKQLDGQLKEIQNNAAAIRQAFDFENQYLDGAYSSGLSSLKQTIADEKTVRDADLAAKLKAFDDEITARQKYASNKLLKPEERIDAENRIKDAIDKRAQAVAKAGNDEVLIEQRNAQAVKQVRDEYDSLRATILELQGKTSAAAGIRIEQQVQAARDAIQKAGGNLGDADVFRQQLLDQQDLRQAQDDYNRLLARSSDLEQSFLLRAEASGASLKDTEQGVYAIRASSLVQLGELRDKVQALADASPANKQLAQDALDIGLAYEKAARQVDPALNRLRDGVSSLSQSISSDLGDAITDFKSLGDVANSVLKDIERFVVKAAITDPLEVSIKGILQSGGIGDAVKGLFGAKPGPAPGGLASGIVAGESAGVPTQSIGQILGLGTPAIAAQTAATTASTAATSASTFATTAATAQITLLGSAASAAASKLFALSTVNAAGSSGIGLLGLGGQIGGGGGFGSGANFGFQDLGLNFDGGGFTGAGDKYQPAGIVHKGEIVWSQSDIAKAGGVSVVEGMRKGVLGYADGGYVGISMPRSAPPPQNRGPQIIIENHGADIQQRQESGPDGEALTRFIIRTAVQQSMQAIAADHASGTGPSSTALRQRGVSLGSGPRRF